MDLTEPAGLTFMVILAGIVLLAVYCIRRIPTAYAWNPDSHDKITCFSLEVLKRENKTLMGWALNVADTRNYAKDNMILQLRRGSIDEDMSSDLFSGLETLNSWFEHMVTALTSFAYTRPIGYIMLAARAAGKYHFKVRDPTQFVEGTNGGYHFYNPVSGVGLSEPTIIAQVLQKVADCVPRPMPTAAARALEPEFTNSTASPWCFDLEKRNYTIKDADDYYSRGYYHISFYSVGRVLHLLQDMAVPAHVRDDSHFGIGLDFSEPLEYYADLKDYVSSGGQINGSNELRWRYMETREYPVETQIDHLKQAESSYPSILTQYKGSDYKTYFNSLAKITHDSNYSAGTIPGNADSHNPDDTDVAPWIPPYPPDFLKCQPNVDSLVDVLRFCYTSIKNVGTYLESLPGHSGLIDAAALGKCTLPDKPSSADIIRFIECLTPFVDSLPVDILNPDKRDVWNEYPGSTIKSDTLDVPKSDRRNFYLISLNVRERWESLTQFQKLLSKDPQRAVTDVMKEWITNSQDRKKLAAVFNGLHGPCCIVNNIEKPYDPEERAIKAKDCDPVLAKQYTKTEVDAIAFSAALLAKWFESQYSPEKKRGIGIWINGTTGKQSQVTDPDMVSGNRVIEQDDNYAWPKDKDTGSIGIVNHLPLELEIEVEISLSDVSDEDMESFPEGIRIKGGYGHFEPEGENGILELGEIKLKKGTPEKWQLKDCKPFNSYTQKKVEIPVENVSYTGEIPMGGIKRGQVDTVLKAISTYPKITPDKPSISEESLPLPAPDIFEKMNSTLLYLEINMGKGGKNAE